MGLAALVELAAVVELAVCHSYLFQVRFRGRQARSEQEN